MRTRIKFRYFPTYFCKSQFRIDTHLILKQLIFQLNTTIMNKILVLICGAMLLYGCGQNSENTSETASTEKPTVDSYDPKRGEGKFESITISEQLDIKLAEKGRSVYDLKCSSCHKLTDEKLVGPGWKGVSSKHKPEWIMNFITNPDAMIDKDPELQSQLELCLVRMPNQNLTDDDARSLLEFMRKNDGVL